MKHAFITVGLLFVCSSLFADPGVVIDAKGKVTIDGAPAKVGSKFADGATIDVPKGASAQLMFSNGSMRRLSPGEKYIAAKGVSTQGGKPLIDGITMALNDAKAKSGGPVVHGMVKELAGKPTANKGDIDINPSRKKKMDADIKMVNLMGLSKDGKAVMLSQVFYKYGQYQKQVNTLLPIYKSQNPPTETVAELLALGYEKLGMPDEAEKYRK